MKSAGRAEYQAEELRGVVFFAMNEYADQAKLRVDGCARCLAVATKESGGPQVLEFVAGEDAPQTVPGAPIDLEAERLFQMTRKVLEKIAKQVNRTLRRGWVYWEGPKGRQRVRFSSLSPMSLPTQEHGVAVGHA